jgi:putative ABC transport system permease protein
VNRWRGLPGEAGRDLAAQGLRTLLLLLTLTGIAWTTVAVHREAAKASADLAATLASPTATFVLVTANSDSAAPGPALIDGVRAIDHVSATLALSAPAVVDTDRPGGDLTVLSVWGQLPGDGWAAPCGTAQVTTAGASALGLADGVGGITVEGTPVSVTARRALPATLARYNLAVLIHRCDTQPAVPRIAIVVDSPNHVAATIRLVQGLFPVEQRTQLTIESQQTQIADAQRVAATATTNEERLTTLTALACAALIAILFGGVVVQRRADYGRRRALGAAPSWIAALVVTQALLLTGAGTVLAVTIEATLTTVAHQPALTARFALGTALMLLSAAGIGALIPAVIAATGDPIREIRVP